MRSRPVPAVPILSRAVPGTCCLRCPTVPGVSRGDRGQVRQAGTATRPSQETRHGTISWFLRNDDEGSTDG